MTPALHLRGAVAADAPVILDFIRQLAEYERLRHECVATEDTVRASLFGAHPAAEVLLAELDGTPVGFALFFPTYSTFLAQAGLYLEDLYVIPSARGQGVGRALLAELARLTVARGWGRLEWSVLDWNAPAIRFYESLGAVPMADWTKYRLAGDALQALGRA